MKKRRRRNERIYPDNCTYRFSKMKSSSEYTEQSKVIKWLRMKDILFTSTLNGVRMSPGLARKMKIAGMEKGVPDILIFSPAYKNINWDMADVARILKSSRRYIGVAVEMKTKKSEKHKLPCGCMAEEQKEWKEKLERNGWIHILAHGADEAIDRLMELGY